MLCDSPWLSSQIVCYLEFNFFKIFALANIDFLKLNLLSYSPQLWHVHIHLGNSHESTYFLRKSTVTLQIFGNTLISF